MTKLTLFIAGLLSVGLIGNAQGMKEEKNVQKGEKNEAMPTGWDRGHVCDIKLYSPDQQWQREEPREWFIGIIKDSELEKTLQEKNKEVMSSIIKQGVGVPGAEFKIVSCLVGEEDVLGSNSELKDLMKPAGSRLVLCVTCSFFSK